MPRDAAAPTMGDAFGLGGIGVRGFATGTGGMAVYGSPGSTGAYAGYFDGDVLVAGQLTSPIATMRLDHPDAPSSRWYQQTLVGSFEQVSVIGGNAVIGTDGTVTVAVPALFARHHRDVRYQLTPVGAAVLAHVGRKLDAGGHFTIAAAQSGLEVLWQLSGVRSDPAALAAPLKVDSRKPARYLRPKVYGEPPSKALEARPRQRRPRALPPARLPDLRVPQTPTSKRA